MTMTAVVSSLLCWDISQLGSAYSWFRTERVLSGCGNHVEDDLFYRILRQIANFRRRNSWRPAKLTLISFGCAHLTVVQA
jgi:hypothetical protein